MSVFCAADLFMFSTGMGCLLSTRIRRRLPPGVRHVVDANRGSGETQRGDRSDGQDLQRPASHHRLAVYAAGKNETRHQLSTNQRHFRKCSCKLPVTWPVMDLCGWRTVYSCNHDCDLCFLWKEWVELWELTMFTEVIQRSTVEWLRWVCVFFIFFLLKQCWCVLWRVSSHFLAIIIK